MSEKSSTDKGSEAEFNMSLVQEYVKKEFVLGEKDRGFAIHVVSDFLEFLKKNDLKIVDAKTI